MGSLVLDRRHRAPLLAGVAILCSYSVQPVLAGIEAWTPVGPPGGVVLGLAHSPIAPRAYHAFNSNAVFTSLDRGATWKRTDSGLANLLIRAVAVVPHSPSVLYAITRAPAGQAALYRTDDRGANWLPVAGSEGLLDESAPLVIAPRTAVIYSRIDGRFARSLDGGATWEIGGQGLPATGIVIDIEVNSSAENVVWVLIRNAPGRPIFRSLDGGATWSRASGGLGDVLLVDLTTGGIHPDIAFAAANNRVFTTNDGGRSWQASSTVNPPEPLLELAFDGVHSGFLYARGSRHLLKSQNRGGAWEVIDGPGNPELPQDILLDTTAAGTLRVATAGGGVLTSTDFGSTWKAPARFEAAEVSSFDVDPATPGTVFSGTSYSNPLTGLLPRYDDVHLSHDDGRGWQALRASALGGFRPSTALAVARAAPFTAYVGIDGGVAASEDGGRTWQARRGFCGAPSMLLIAPSDPRVVYAEAGTLEPGECLGANPPACAAPRSLDGGLTWQCLEHVIMAIAPHDARVLYRQRSNGPLERSSDAGATWSSLGSPSPGAFFTGVALSPSDPGRLYLTTHQHVWVSQDGGATWTSTNGPPIPAGLSNLVVDPLDADRIHLLQNASGPPLLAPLHGVWTSDDGGASWRSISVGLPGAAGPTRGLVIDATDPNTLYTSVPGRGLFRYTFSRSSGCVADATTLCLANERFRVRSHWRDFQGRTGVAQARPVTSDTGAFWFFRPDNLELVAKIVDGTPINDHFWFFEASLSNVEFTIEVHDTTTGMTQRYFNPSGTFASRGDTGTFLEPGFLQSETVASDNLEQAAFDPDVVAELGDATTGAGPCQPTPISLCLMGRFRVTVDWYGFGGRPFRGQPVAITGDTGAFYFFNGANLEIFAKIVDGTDLNGHFWFFHAGLSDVAYEITVRDVVTQRAKTYRNTAGSFASGADTAALPE